MPTVLVCNGLHFINKPLQKSPLQVIRSPTSHVEQVLVVLQSGVDGDVEEESERGEHGEDDESAHEIASTTSAQVDHVDGNSPTQCVAVLVG